MYYYTLPILIVSGNDIIYHCVFTTYQSRKIIKKNEDWDKWIDMEMEREWTSFTMCEFRNWDKEKRLCQENNIKRRDVEWNKRGGWFQ